MARKQDYMNSNDSFIVIVDDNTCDLDLIKRAFELYIKKDRILCINNGRDALAYLMGDGVFADRDNYPYPSMLLTDINMPGVDGFDILEHLQNNPTNAIVPSIVLSSSEDTHDINTAYRLGACSYFVKPYKYSELCNLINTLLGYWKINKTPIKDQFGKFLITDSRGKLGARFSLPN